MIDGDQEVWKYDKRFHTSLEDSLRVPAIETPPEYQVRLVGGCWSLQRECWWAMHIQGGQRRCGGCCAFLADLRAADAPLL